MAYKDKDKTLKGKHSNYKHGGCVGGRTRLYRIWVNMIQRCCNEKTLNYPRYGGKGIYVIPKWQLSFENFRDWALVSGYADNLTIDRINNDEGYMPQNCQWILMIENLNKRQNVGRPKKIRSG